MTEERYVVILSEEERASMIVAIDDYLREQLILVRDCEKFGIPYEEGYDRVHRLRGLLDKVRNANY